MRPGDRKPVPTVAEAVTAATAICDADGADELVTAFQESFESDERPASAVEDLRGELEGVAGGIDPEGSSPALQMAAEVALWLTTNMDQANDRSHVLREAARLGFRGNVPTE